MATHADSICLSTAPGVGRYSDFENEIIIPAVLEVVGWGQLLGLLCRCGRGGLV